MSTELWDRIEQARTEWNVLEHPFYVRWSAGELSREELADYAGQYRYATEAIAKLAADVAELAPEEDRAGLRTHAEEEAEHVAMWDGFVGAVGGTVGAEPNSETLECVERWTAADGLGPALARLYAIESGQPSISETKREGLIEHYGVVDGPGTEYFRVHREMDTEHAAEGRNLIERYANDLDEQQMAEAAETAFRANWKLLDGVTRN